MTDVTDHGDQEPADGADSVTEGARTGLGAPQRRGVAGVLRRPRAIIVTICVVVVAGALGAVAMATHLGSGQGQHSDELPCLDRVGGLAPLHAQGGRGGD